MKAFKENVANLQDDEGQRPLHTAAAEGRLEMVKLLLANGAKVNSPDKQLWTALHYACKEGCVLNASRIPLECFYSTAFLVSCALYDFGRLLSSLNHAMHFLFLSPRFPAFLLVLLLTSISHLTVAQLLLENKAELFASDNGTTPLHYFARIDPKGHETSLYFAVLDGLLQKPGT